MTDSTKKPARSKGAQPGNQNAVRHGLRASALPAGCRYIDGQVRAFRTYCRDLITSRDGECSIYHEAVLQSAVRHEQRAMLAAKWLRDESENLKPDERLKFLDAISKATDARDKCLEKLKLDVSAKDSNPWDGIIAPASPATPTSELAASNAPRKAADAISRQGGSEAIEAPSNARGDEGKAHASDNGNSSATEGVDQ